MSGTVLSPVVADRKFFERFPHRRHRIRIAARNEIEHARRKGVLTAPIPDGCRGHIGVMSDGCGRLRSVIGALLEGADCDMSEADAIGAFALLRRQDDALLVAWANGRRA